MRTTPPLYEGDGYVHPAPVVTEPVDVWEIEQRAKAMRRAVIGEALRRFGDWIGKKLRSAARRDLENYLSQSTDHADLERRLREFELRRQPSPYY
jgi:hypothetical protein